jgi:hypothetical protein
MDGRTFRYHDNHEFFRSPTRVETDGLSPSHTQTVARKRPMNSGQTPFALPTSVEEYPCLGHVMESLQAAPQHNRSGFSIGFSP